MNKTQATRPAPPSTAVARKPRPAQRRLFIWTTDQNEYDRVCGPALRPDDVIRSHLQDLAGWHACALASESETSFEFASHIDDFTLWEGNRLLAVVRVMPNGHVETVRFEPGCAGPTVTLTPLADLARALPAAEAGE